MREGHIVLIGEMGSGKTTVGGIVAAALGRPLVDSDEQIEARFGESGRLLAEDHGVEWLHQAEAGALIDALDRVEPAVICPAASIADRPDLLDRLEDPALTVALLDGDPVVLRERVAEGDHRRPLDPEEARVLAAARRDRTRRVVSLVVDVTSIEPDEAAARVLRHVVA